MKNRVISIIACIAVALAFVVVVLGAYARLTDSGLGCPDWPGCYGHWVLPHSHSALEQAQAAFPQQMMEPGKAWREMIHRYAAGTLGLLIFTLFIQAVYKKISPRHPFSKEKNFLGLTTLLIGLLVFQAMLGMWTVTWQLLPLVVMGHLVGGLTILSVLRYLQLTLRYASTPLWPSVPRRNYTCFLWIGLLLVALQIILGGWVSANYAGLACVGFPQCNGLCLPKMNFYQAFQFFSPIGVDYQGGQLDSVARVTIQMVHRFNALLTTGYILIFGAWVVYKEKTKRLRRSAITAMLIVLIQFSLGVILVTHLLPLSLAVAHNALAALLLLTMVSWIFYYYHET